MSILSVALVSALAWAKASVLPLVVGFITRHFSAPILAKAKALLAKLHDAVQAVLAWVHSKL